MPDHALCRHELELAIARGGGGADVVEPDYHGPYWDGHSPMVTATCPHGRVYLVVPHAEG